VPAKSSALQGLTAMANPELAEAVMHLREVTSGYVLLNGNGVTRLRVARHRRMEFHTFRRDAAMSARSLKCPCGQCDSWFAEKVHTAVCFEVCRRSGIREALVARFGIRSSGIDLAAGKLSVASPEADPGPGNYAWIGSPGR